MTSSAEMLRSQAYWRASDAWAMAGLRLHGRRRSSIPEDQTSEGKARQAEARASRFAAWARNTGRPAPHRSASPSGTDAVVVGADLWNAVAALAGAAAPALAGAMDRHLAQLAFDAWRSWPVSSGWSKSLLLLEYTTPSDGVIVGSISSYAKYTKFIKSQPFRSLVDSKGLAVATAIGTEAVADLAKGGGRV